MTSIEARPRHVFSWGFNLGTPEGPLTTVDLSWIREGGRMVWRGRDYRFGREGLWGGDFYVMCGEEPLAVATKESSLFRRFVVTVGTRRLVLEAASPFTRRFLIREGTREVGSIAPRHPFTRVSTLRFPDDLEVPVRVFLFWLAALMWRRAASSD